MHPLMADLAAAFGLLTRLPVPPALLAAPRPAAAWAWPVAGAVVGAIAAGVAAFAMALGLPAPVAAGLALAAMALATGGLHEDGLADTADGLWGGGSPARRLEIMRDSRIGSYGALALVLVTLIRWQALAACLALGLWAAPIAAAALARAAMAGVMAALPNARPGGLSHSTGRPTAAVAGAAAGLALLFALALTGGGGLAMAVLAMLAAAATGAVARARIGGQTGDILGAACLLAETAALLALLASA